MKLEYIETGSVDCPLIRIYGEESFDSLIAAFCDLSNERLESVVVEDLPNYESINGCHLIISAGIIDDGIRKISSSNSGFSWVMKRSSWDDLAELAEPFHVFQKHQYQWLAGREARMPNLSASNIALVVSTYPDGQW
jgi:hypothetical protein